MFLIGYLYAIKISADKKRLELKAEYGKNFKCSKCSRINCSGRRIESIENCQSFIYRDLGKRPKKL